MLGDFIYSDDINDAEFKYDSSQKVENKVRRFLLLAAVFISAGVLWIFLISPSTVPARIEVRSFAGFDRANVLYQAGIAEGSTYIAINAVQAQELLSRHYMVETARVVKRFPDRLSIYLEPRRAVAVTLARFNGKIQPVYIDRHGVVMRIGNSAGETPPSWLPVVSGLFDNNLQPWLGMKLPASLVPLFMRIGAINDEDQNIWLAISEIGIAQRSNELYDLVLFPVNNSIRLRMGSDINIKNIYYALLMADASWTDSPREIDVRSGIGVFRTQEARFGE